jgi:hypothetical protein
MSRKPNLPLASEVVASYARATEHSRYAQDRGKFSG